MGSTEYNTPRTGVEKFWKLQFFTSSVFQFSCHTITGFSSFLHFRIYIVLLFLIGSALVTNDEILCKYTIQMVRTKYMSAQCPKCKNPKTFFSGHLILIYCPIS